MYFLFNPTINHAQNDRCQLQFLKLLGTYKIHFHLFNSPIIYIIIWPKDGKMTYMFTSLFFNPLWKNPHLAIGKGKKLMQFEIKSQYFIVFWNKVTDICEYDGCFWTWEMGAHTHYNIGNFTKIEGPTFQLFTSTPQLFKWG